MEIDLSPSSNIRPHKYVTVNMNSVFTEIETNYVKIINFLVFFLLNNYKNMTSYLLHISKRTSSLFLNKSHLIVSTVWQSESLRVRIYNVIYGL